MNANKSIEDRGPSPWSLADFYKTGHPSMYPLETTKLVSNFTPRTSKYAPVLEQLFDNKVVWFGLQGFIKEYLLDVFTRDFFAMPKAQAIGKFKRRTDAALGKDAVAVDKIEALHDLGYLPLEIRSLPEGARVNIKVPPVLFISTHERFPWVAMYFETLFSCENWKPSTVATIAFEFRKLLTYFAGLTGAPAEFVDWQGHDFSMRGMSGVHDAMRCGAGHLLSFCGTDTIPAIDYAEDFYGANAETELIGGSIPATEHSVMTLRILLKVQQLQHDPAYAGVDEKTLLGVAELEVVRELVTKDYPAGMVSIVSDSFDFWRMMTVIARDLKDVILSRKPDAFGMCKVVFRPDSGDPVHILTGYCDDELACDATGTPLRNDAGTYALADGSGSRITEAERKGAIQCLWDVFGGTVTSKGYKVLNPAVGTIYGDSITLERASRIMLRLAEKGFASCNFVLGIGSYTYNMLSRDTFGWAMKAIYAEVGDARVEIYKDPATDDGTKKSARGLLRVEKEGNDYVLYQQQTVEAFEGGALVPVYRDGKLLVTTTLAEVRERLKASWVCPEPGSIEWTRTR